jgi:hypothetical protein
MGRITNTSHPLRIQEDFFRIFIFFYDGHPSPEICCPKEMGAVILPRVIIKQKWQTVLSAIFNGAFDDLSD